MTPLDFLEFRNLLTPSSGFQSLQFRLIEATLGLQLTSRHEQDYYKRINEGGFNSEDYNQINTIEKQENLLVLINQWLRKNALFNIDYWHSFQSKQTNDLHPFWNTYRTLYAEGLTEREKPKLKDFDWVFFNKQAEDFSQDQLTALSTSLTPTAMRSALFIMLYRDFPVFQTSYQILDSLIEIDHMLSNWRHKHFIMVRRMIGMRVGTGNTSGSGYLRRCFEQALYL